MKLLDRPRIFIILLVVGFGFFLIFATIAKGVFIVEPQDNAVIVRDGQVVRVVKPGINFSIPILDSVFHYPVNRKFKWITSIGKESSPYMSNTKIHISIYWSVSTPTLFYKKLGAFDKNKVEKLLTPITEAELSKVQLRTNEPETYDNSQYSLLLKTFQDRLNDNLSSYGIKVIRVEITSC